MALILKKILGSLYYRYVPSLKPKIIQMPVIDICNSKCEMCNIWMNKKDERLNCQAMRAVLQDPYFREVESVGINGGEPTLRDDLPELTFEVINALPRLKAINIFTNSIHSEKICLVLDRISTYAKERHVEFFVMLSIDGFGEIHDQVRGTPGNFQSVIQVIDYLKSKKIPFGVGTTITRTNLYDIDNLNEWLATQGVRNHEIRLGVEIKRLYNKGFYKKQALNQIEIFQLSQFFHGLFLKTDNYFYYSLFRQLAYGENRRAGCWWQHRGITLDSRGDVSFCSVASPIIGNAINNDVTKIVKTNLFKLKKIKSEKCSSCMHDLNGPLPLSSSMELARQFTNNRLARINKRVMRQYLSMRKREEPYFLSSKRPSVKSIKNVLITGWWGTETQGDKAILGELLCFLSEHCPNLESVTLSSYENCEYVVQQTIDELIETSLIRIKNFKSCISINSIQHDNVVTQHDAIFIGGGPLERLPELTNIASAFIKFRNRGKVSFVFGCGIDVRLAEYTDVVRQILLSASHVLLRDRLSAERAVDLLNISINQLQWATDPALNFVRRWSAHYGNTVRDNIQPYMVTLLRANTSEYSELPHDELNRKNLRLVDVVSHALSNVDFNVELQCMNTLHYGFDDRFFNRSVLRNISDTTNRVVLEKKYLTLNQLLMRVRDCQIVLASRFHAHIFSAGLGKPFVSLDYTGKGNKIEGFVDSFANYKVPTFAWHCIEQDQFRQSLDDTWQNYSNLTLKITNDVDAQVSKLISAYNLLTQE
jgi:MoaA/NifB/PqqE/SkfB family radical SAM enzyme/polysaccharide pyruvyl transferase WcaK-like protein